MIKKQILLTSLAALLGATTVMAATRTWDGGTGGTGTEIGTAANWSGDTLPSVNGDVAQWDGTVAGNLVLTHGTANFAGSSGNTGVSLNLTATQTGSLSIDSGANTSGIRLNNITIASGAGAFTFGNGAGTFNLTIGGAAGTRTYQNDSANTATLASDLTLNTGSAGIQTFAFAGTGNWTVNCNLAGGNRKSVV